MDIGLIHMPIGELVAMVVVFGAAAFFGWHVFVVPLRRKPQHERERVQRQVLREQRASRSSGFSAKRVSATETIYSNPDITVTCNTNRASREVSFEWAFAGSPSSRRVELAYTSNMNAFQIGETLDDDDTGLAGLALFASMAAESKKESPGSNPLLHMISSPTQIPQPFAPPSTLVRGHAARVLPEGTWYVRFTYSAGGMEDHFDYPALLDKSVRDAPRELKLEKRPEEEWQERIRRLGETTQTLRDGLLAYQDIELEIMNNPKLNPENKKTLAGELRRLKEQLVRDSRG